MAIDPRDITSYDEPLVRDLQATFRRQGPGDEPPYSRDPYSDPRIEPGTRVMRYRAAPRRGRRIFRR